MGECNKQTAFEMMDYFYENGGNFIDTFVTVSASRNSLAKYPSMVPY